MAEKSLLRDLGISPLELAIGAGVLYGGYKLFTGVGEKFGLIKGESGKKADELLGMESLGANYLAKLQAEKKKFYVFTSKGSAPDIAEKFYKAKGFFKDSMDVFWGALKRIKYKTQFAQVADVFQKQYGKDLIAYLLTYIDKDEIATVSDYIKNLPSGIV